MTEQAAKHIGYGLAWMGFWIGLGIYNFQGCVPQVKVAHEIKQGMEQKP